MLMVRRKMDGKPAIVFNGKAIATTLFGVFATVVFGVGMCMVMVWEMMVPGTIVGIVGIVLLHSASQQEEIMRLTDELMK